jgi:hypothetical protein
MLENDNHQQNMLHVRMEGRQQHMLQRKTYNMHTLNIKILTYIACYWNNVSLKKRDWLPFCRLFPT